MISSADEDEEDEEYEEEEQVPLPDGTMPPPKKRKRKAKKGRRSKLSNKKQDFQVKWTFAEQKLGEEFIFFTELALIR